MKYRSLKPIKGETFSNDNAETLRYLPESPHILFENIYRKSVQLGLKSDDLKKLREIQEIRKCKSAKRIKFFGFLLKILFIVVFASLFVFVTEWPISNSHILVWWYQWNNLDPFKEPCLATIPEVLIEPLTPPINCEFCRNVYEVDHVANISKKLFEQKYAYSGLPVVITDGTRNWTASSVFSYGFMQEMFSPNSEALEKVEKDCQFFPYKSDFTSLGNVFEMSEERATMKSGAKPWYIGWSNCDQSAANVLRKHYERPYFLPELSESSKTDWIFMGSPGYGAHLHIDHVEHPSWQAQITGKKRWRLEPPPDCYFTCPRNLEVVVNEGEIIVLDTNRWYHSTLNVGETISITIGSEYD